VYIIKTVGSAVSSCAGHPTTSLSLSVCSATTSAFQAGSATSMQPSMLHNFITAMLVIFLLTHDNPHLSNGGPGSVPDL